MTVLVDMDDVIEKLIDGLVDYINDKYGTTATAEDVKEWDLSKAFPTLTREQVYGAELDDALWDKIRPMPGAREALEKLISEGHEVYIVTATYYQTLRAKMEKVLFNYFPFISWNHVIITSNKQMIKGDVLVDDGPHNLVGGDYKKILFEASHNKDFDEKSIGAVRVRNWEEAYKAIESIGFGNA